MICLEQFIRGSFHRVGYRTLATDNVRSILTPDDYEYLQGLTGNGIHLTPLNPAMYVAITKLTTTHDEYGRPATWNHTILVSVKQYIELAWAHSISQLLEPLFTPPMHTLSGKRSLEPLTLEVPDP